MTEKQRQYTIYITKSIGGFGYYPNAYTDEIWSGDIGDIPDEEELPILLRQYLEYVWNTIFDIEHDEDAMKTIRTFLKECKEQAEDLGGDYCEPELTYTSIHNTYTNGGHQVYDLEFRYEEQDDTIQN